ncbi:MAG: FecR domain-containing protein [Tannerella sp.]|jgi:ferric-dicitrate binding protein FerR (iron transport regulator)|nr:FecR domain-containing protein [Tannerella sp.]
MQDHLIDKYFNKTLSFGEKQELFARMETDEALRKAFISLQNLHALSFFLPDGTIRPDMAGKLKQFKRKVRRRRLIRSLRHAAGYAAAIILTATITWAILKAALTDDGQPVMYTEFSVPAGQHASVKLHDGTAVWLNARTTLRYPNVFTEGERRVELDGEAFFDVAQRPGQPFVVSAGKSNIRATGTQFNVFAYRLGSEFHVSLIEGVIEVSDADRPDNILRLLPNECAELQNDRFVKKTFRNTDFLLWRDGIYAFDNVPFTEIIKKLELYYDITIHVNNRKPDAYKFNGKFRQRDGVVSVLRKLQMIHYFSFSKDDENNIITIN